MATSLTARTTKLNDCDFAAQLSDGGYGVVSAITWQAALEGAAALISYGNDSTALLYEWDPDMTDSEGYVLVGKLKYSDVGSRE